MKLTRDLTGGQLIKALEKFGYEKTRQSGSHVRLTCAHPDVHNITVPLHDPLRIGTLSSILYDVAEHHNVTRDALIQTLFGK
jgi:predicted RNA binding protein YcfA (HicA-like mRNA interferase family)